MLLSSFLPNSICFEKPCSSIIRPSAPVSPCWLKWPTSLSSATIDVQMKKTESSLGICTSKTRSNACIYAFFGLAVLLLFFSGAGREFGLTAADCAQSCWHILTCSAHTNSLVNLQADKAPELGKREKAPALSQSARAGLQVCFNSSSVWSVWAEQTGPSGGTDLSSIPLLNPLSLPCLLCYSFTAVPCRSYSSLSEGEEPKQCPCGCQGCSVLCSYFGVFDSRSARVGRKCDQGS